MAETPVYLGRVFIDPDPETNSSIVAFVKTGVNTWSHKESKKERPYVDASVTLTDCSRSIHWSFDARDRKALEKMLTKAENAIQVLQAFRDGLAATRDHLPDTQQSYDDD